MDEHGNGGKEIYVVPRNSDDVNRSLFAHYFDLITETLAKADAAQKRVHERLAQLKIPQANTGEPDELWAYATILTQALEEVTKQKHNPDLPLLSNKLNHDIDFLSYVEVQVKVVKKLLSSIYKVLADLSDEELPDHVPHPINFIKNNKLPAPDDEEIKRARTRFPLSNAEELANTLDFTDKEMAKILTISIRTYHRLKPNGLLNPIASERLLLLKDLADYGLEVFENQRNFNEWLRLPLHELSNASPLTSLDTATGFLLVKTILGRIDYGVYS